MVAGAAVLVWCTALSGYDIRHRRLPNWLTLPGAVVILSGAVAAGHGGPALAGAGVLFAAYATVHLAAPAALGAGDVKLALGTGALTGAFGPDVWLLAALAAPLLTAVCGLVAVAARARCTLAHGPSMCLASAVAVGLTLV
ncbi:prepilin peptidase [Mycobacterium sp. WMMD1722]|uniref:prepilin peptidase n=1 Tax=Mycobacterium sp. WMMD1722 TaxID=3404117 RepID=UPI003BF5082B